MAGYARTAMVEGQAGGLGVRVAAFREEDVEVRGRGLRVELAGGEAVDAAKVLGPLRDLRRVAAGMKPTRIVVGMTERREKMPVPDLLPMMRRAEEPPLAKHSSQRMRSNARAHSRAKSADPTLLYLSLRVVTS